MSKGISCFVKGLGTGAVIGMTVAVGCKMMCKENKCAKKKLSHAARSVSDFLDNISYMMK